MDEPENVVIHISWDGDVALQVSCGRYEYLLGQPRAGHCFVILSRLSLYTLQVRRSRLTIIMSQTLPFPIQGQLEVNKSWS